MRNVFSFSISPRSLGKHLILFLSLIYLILQLISVVSTLWGCYNIKHKDFWNVHGIYLVFNTFNYYIFSVYSEFLLKKLIVRKRNNIVNWMYLILSISYPHNLFSMKTLFIISSYFSQLLLDSMCVPWLSLSYCCYLDFKFPLISNYSNCKLWCNIALEHSSFCLCWNCHFRCHSANHRRTKNFFKKGKIGKSDAFRWARP